MRWPNIPPERMRMHLCWGNYEGPHHHDVPLADIIDVVFTARPATISFEAANPRHAHEWTLFETGQAAGRQGADSRRHRIEIELHRASGADRAAHRPLRQARRPRERHRRQRLRLTAPGSARPRSIPTWCGRNWRRWPKARASPQSNSGTDRPHGCPSRSSHRDHARSWPCRRWAGHQRASHARFDSILRPIRAFRLNYVPVVMVYFAYGALGLIDVTRDLWIKESLSFTPSQLAGIGVWLSAALDREDGVRRTGGHRADLRLAAQSLYPDRRRCSWPRAWSSSPAPPAAG